MKFPKTPITVLTFAVIVGLSIGLYAFLVPANSGFSASQESADTDPVHKMTLSEEVDSSGAIKPVQNVDLAFQREGKVSQIYADVDSHVTAGQILISLENTDASAQVLQAQAALKAQQAKLSELNHGTRSEDIEAQTLAVTQAQAALKAQQAKLDALNRGTRSDQLQIYKTSVSNAGLSVDEAQKNLDTTNEKTKAALETAYNSAVTAAEQAVEIAKVMLYTLTDIQYAHYRTGDQNSVAISQAKKDAVYTLLGAENAGDWMKDYLSPLRGGTYGEVLDAVSNPTDKNTDQALQATLTALNAVKQALDTVPDDSNKLSSPEETNLNTAKNNVNAQITAITAQEQAVNLQKTTNSNAIALAEAGLTAAKNAAASARDQLAMADNGADPQDILAQQAAVEQAQANVNAQQAKLDELKNGNRPETIAAQEALVEQAQGALQNAQVQLANAEIVAPFDGIISKMDAKLGEVVAPNLPLISMISSGQYEIETSVSEADIAKVKIGDSAKVTTDAYGNSVVFDASVISIDPAETMINAVPAYKIKLLFNQEDARIKSGLTVNVQIITQVHANVIAVPESAIFTRGDDHFVLVLTGKSGSEERKVILGIRGANGYTEILSGLAEGEEVLTLGYNQQ